MAMMNKQKLGCVIGSMLIVAVILTACSLSKQQFSVQAVEQSLVTNTIEVEPTTITIDTSADDFTYYDLTVQQEIQQQIDEEKSKGASFEAPLLIINPYGTNTTSLYLYFTDEEESKLQVSISAEGYTTYTNLYDDTCEITHEHQIIGMVGGVENTITLTLLDENDNAIKEESFTIQAPALASGFDTTIEKSEGSSTQSLSDGLYVALGLNFTYDGYTFLIDNDGVVRGELVLDADMNETIEFYEDCMLLNTDETHMALINALGKVVSVYDLQQYEVHHDYEINEEGIAIILVNDTTKDTVEDVILALDLATGDFEPCIDFTQLMADYKAITNPFGEDSVWGSYGDTSWDWLHFNTIELINEDEMILSSRETSTIMKLSNIYDDVSIDYFIADDATWEGTAYEQYLLDKNGNFSDTAGQHTVTYASDDSLEEGQYYLYMFNNNFWSYESRESYQGSVTDASTEFNEGTASYYTRYLVDETLGTYTLVDRMAVPYSSIVSSTQWVGDNLIVNSGVAKTFNVYDQNQELIATYSYDQEDLFQGYRILKYDFIGFWFA